MTETKFNELKELTEKTFRAHYFFGFMDSEAENLSINPNDKLTNKEKLISDFKKKAVFRLVRDEFDVNEFRWVLSDENRQKITEMKNLLPMSNVHQLKKEIIDLIIADTKKELQENPELTLSQTSAFKQLHRVDEICCAEHFQPNETFTDNTLQKAELLSLIKEPFELSDITKEIEKSGRFNYFNIFTDPKSQFELFASHNNLYISLSHKMQDHLVENYFLRADMTHGIHPRLSELYLWSYKNKEPSMLGIEIADHDKFNDLKATKDIVRHDYFYHHKGFCNSVIEFVNNSDIRSLTEKQLNEKLFVLHRLIDVGMLDSETQNTLFFNQTERLFNELNFSTVNSVKISSVIHDAIQKSKSERNSILQENVHYEARNLIKYPLLLNDYVDTGFIKSHFKRLEKADDYQLVYITDFLQRNPGSEYGKMLSKVVDQKFISKVNEAKEEKKKTTTEIDNTELSKFPNSLSPVDKLSELLNKQYPALKNTNSENKIRPKF